VVDKEQTDKLREFYRQLALDPLEPDDPRYVPLYDDDEDPVLALMEGVQFSPGESTQLLSGYRGSGKSTELRRLKQYLENDRYAVVLVDIEDYLNTASPVDIVDYLLALVAAFEEASPGEPEHKGLLTRLTGILGRVRVDEPTVSVPGSILEFKLSLKSSSAFVDQLRKYLAGSLGELVKAVREMMAELVKAILTANANATEVVLLVDSGEHFRGTLTTDADVQASVENLFFNQADNLQFRGLHVVYTVPPYLKTRVGGAAGKYRPGAPLQVIPAVKVRNEDGQENEDGLAALRQIVEVRGKWREVLGEDGEQVRRISLASGGHLRDLIRLLQEVIRRSMRVDHLPAPERVVTGAIDQIAREFLPLADDDALALWRVHNDHDSPMESIAGGLTTLSRFLDTHLLLCYRNGREWYDVHPLIVDDAWTTSPLCRADCEHSIQRKSRDLMVAVLRTRGSMCSAKTLMTPSTFSTVPRISNAGWARATRRNRVHAPRETITLIRPVSSSRLMKMVPWAVAGRWRWVTIPPTVTRARSATSTRPAAVTTPCSASAARTNSVG